jgi:hypothetical protein
MKVKFSLRGLNKNKENIMGMQTIRVIKKTKDNVTYRLLYLPKETKVDDITTSWESSELMKKYSKYGLIRYQYILKYIKKLFIFKTLAYIFSVITIILSSLMYIFYDESRSILINCLFTISCITMVIANIFWIISSFMKIKKG